MSISSLALGDLRDRTRRYSFFVSVALALYLGFLFIPPQGAKFYYTLTLGQFRGVYNSAWVGHVMALSLCSFVVLFGFYLVRGTVARDARTGVGQCLAATPMSDTSYIASRFFSNAGYLTMLVAAVAAMAPVMQLLRGEVSALEVVQLFGPFVWLTMPCVLLVSGIATFFDVTPVLRGGWGNIIYFYTFMPLMVIPVELGTEFDFMGLAILQNDLKAAITAAGVGYTGGFSLGHMGLPLPEGSFVWQGIAWTPARVMTRLLWPLAGLVLTFVSVPLFSRFDPAKIAARSFRGGASGSDLLSRTADSIFRLILTPAHNLLRLTRFGQFVSAELKIALLGQNAFLLVVGIALNLALLFSPFDVSRSYILAIVWILPVLVWSQIGVRERTFRVDQVLFSTPGPVVRQAVAAWLAGVAVGLGVSLGFVLRGALTGEWQAVALVISAAVFAPSLALFLGVISRSSRLFEVLYLLLWYVGPVNSVSVADFLGVTRESAASNVPFAFATVGVALVSIALAVRWRQSRS